MGILDFPGLVGSRLHHLAGLPDGLFPGQLVDCFGFAVGLFQQIVCLLPCLPADLFGLGVGGGQYLFFLCQYLLPGFVMRTALDAQRRLGFFGTVGQFFIFAGQVSVFQTQYRHLVRQRVVALLHFGITRFQVALPAGNFIGLPGQRRILGGQVLVLPQQSLATAAQCLALLPGRTGFGRCRIQALLIITAQRTQRLAHIFRLITAETGLAHPALFHILVYVNLCHTPQSPDKFL